MSVSEVSGIVSDISRGSLHDGPGVRTVVYLKGCGLRCRWCHNPETFSGTPELLFAPVRCIGCRRCLEVCPEHHLEQDGRHVYLREGCRACGRCAEACPAGALRVSGERMTATRVFAAVDRDAPFYRRSGGGVTVSGGECLLQPEFTATILSMCRDAGIDTAIETALFVPWESVETVLPFLCRVYADLKLPDDARHREYTGQDGAGIRENLGRLCRIGIPVTVRIPLIPGVNDGAADLRGFAGILEALGEGLREVELLKYNPLAGSKYEMTGREHVSFGLPQRNEEMETLAETLREELPGIPVTFRP